MGKMKKIMVTMFLVLGILMLTRTAALADGSKFVTNYCPQPATPVPEPATMLLLTGGLAGLYGWHRKNRRNR